MKSCLYISLLLFVPLFFGACEKEKVGPQYKRGAGGEDVISGERVLYVVNEGNFQSGNASVTRVLPSSGSVTQRVFKKWTDRSLGDVAQAMIRFDGKFFIVVNNSGKVEVVSAGIDRKYFGAIGGMESPRYFLGLNPKKAYVTDLYADQVHILDPTEMELKGGIATDGWCEELHEKDGKVFVTNMDQGRLDVIDPTKDAFVDSLKLSEQPNSIVEDANGKLWVLCDGGFEEDMPALYRIDPQQVKVEERFEFDNITMSPGNLDISTDRRTLYFLQSGVQRMEVSDKTLPDQKLVEEGQGQFYNLEVEGDGAKEQILVTDAKDYVQKGALYRFRTDGSSIDTFQTGIIPNDVHFKLE